MMGTSGSSKGPGPRVPMVPPWADPPPSGEADNNSGAEDNTNGDANGSGSEDTNNSTETAQQNSPLSPPGRFAGARTNLGSYGKSGDAKYMRRGISQYVSKGYGGSTTAARRMKGTARIAGGLSAALSGGGGPSGAEEYSSSAVEQLRGKSADEVINGIVDVVAPVDGSQDAEASRESIREVLAEVVHEKPDVDLLELDDKSREFIIERFVAADVYRRIVLDIGKKIQDASPNAKQGLKRLRQVKDYVREIVNGAFNSIRASAGSSQPTDITKIVSDALLATFTVFETYTQ